MSFSLSKQTLKQINDDVARENQIEDIESIFDDEQLNGRYEDTLNEDEIMIESTKFLLGLTTLKELSNQFKDQLKADFNCVKFFLTKPESSDQQRMIDIVKEKGLCNIDSMTEAFKQANFTFKQISKFFQDRYLQIQLIDKRDNQIHKSLFARYYMSSKSLWVKTQHSDVINRDFKVKTSNHANQMIRFEARIIGFQQMMNQKCGNKRGYSEKEFIPFPIIAIWNGWIKTSDIHNILF